MTLRYAAVMPTTLRREFDQAFAEIDEEHRVTAQVRVMLSPEAHVDLPSAAQQIHLIAGTCLGIARRRVAPLHLGAFLLVQPPNVVRFRPRIRWSPHSCLDCPCTPQVASS